MENQHYLLMQKCGAADAYYGDLVNRLVRERYSLSEELSLLRRRDEAPEAFAAYSSFVESCKRTARERIGGAV